MQHQATWPSAVLCEVLGRQSSRPLRLCPAAGYPRGDHDEGALLARVRAIHTETRQSYGSRRMPKQLQAEGFSVGRDKARRLMPEAGVTVRHRKRCPVTTDSRHGYAVAPNLWARQFDVEKSDTVWAGDITYLWTAEGW